MFVTESLLAFTIFRDEFDIPFAVMFGCLLFFKCFHWLVGDRMESVSLYRYTNVIATDNFIDGPNSLSRTFDVVSRPDANLVCHPMGCRLCGL